MRFSGEERMRRRVARRRKRAERQRREMVRFIFFYQ